VKVGCHHEVSTIGGLVVAPVIVSIMIMRPRRQTGHWGLSSSGTENLHKARGPICVRNKPWFDAKAVPGAVVALKPSHSSQKLVQKPVADKPCPA
jgi:hypothetical protein